MNNDPPFWPIALIVAVGFFVVAVIGILESYRRERVRNDFIKWLLSKEGKDARDKMSGEDWVGLLISNPALSVHCDWDKLNSWDWKVLLDVRPEFRVHCDFSKLSNTAISCIIKKGVTK